MFLAMAHLVFIIIDGHYGLELPVMHSMYSSFLYEQILQYFYLIASMMKNLIKEPVGVANKQANSVDISITFFVIMLSCITNLRACCSCLFYL